jgi:hypothetical protein
MINEALLYVQNYNSEKISMNLECNFGNFVIDFYRKLIQEKDFLKNAGAVINPELQIKLMNKELNDDDRTIIKYILGQDQLNQLLNNEIIYIDISQYKKIEAMGLIQNFMIIKEDKKIYEE